MTNYNRLQYIVKNITARTGDKPANRKGATLQAFIDAHNANVPAYVAFPPVPAEPVALPFGLTDDHVQLAADAIVGAAMIVAAVIVFAKWCRYAGALTREYAESFASLYSEVSYRLTHNGVALPATDRADSAIASDIVTEVLTTVALATVTAIANTGSVILHYTAQYTRRTVNGIAESAIVLTAAAADEIRIVRIARAAIALPALYAC